MLIVITGSKLYLYLYFVPHSQRNILQLVQVLNQTDQLVTTSIALNIRLSRHELQIRTVSICRAHQHDKHNLDPIKRTSEAYLDMRNNIPETLPRPQALIKNFGREALGPRMSHYMKVHMKQCIVATDIQSRRTSARVYGQNAHTHSSLRAYVNLL